MKPSLFMYKRSAVKYIVIIKQYLVFTLCTSVDSHARPPLQAKTQYLFIDIIIRYRNIEVVHLKSPIQDKLLQGHLHAAIVPSYLYHRKIYIFQLICMFYKNTLFRLCLTARILLFRHFSPSLCSWSSSLIRYYSNGRLSSVLQLMIVVSRPIIIVLHTNITNGSRFHLILFNYIERYQEVSAQRHSS